MMSYTAWGMVLDSSVALAAAATYVHTRVRRLSPARGRGDLADLATYRDVSLLVRRAADTPLAREALPVLARIAASGSSARLSTTLADLRSLAVEHHSREPGLAGKIIATIDHRSSRTTA